MEEVCNSTPPVVTKICYLCEIKKPVINLILLYMFYPTRIKINDASEWKHINSEFGHCRTLRNREIFENPYKKAPGINDRDI